MPVRHFTLEEANRTLPYVSRVVEDVVGEYERWRDRIQRYEILVAKSRSEDAESQEQTALRVEVDEIARRINGFIDELTAVGCVFKGFEGGLVDFYSRLDGRDIFLCWRLGEPEIRYWHELDAGFVGRQELAIEFVNEQAE